MFNMKYRQILNYYALTFGTKRKLFESNKKLRNRLLSMVKFTTPYRAQILVPQSYEEFQRRLHNGNTE